MKVSANSKKINFDLQSAGASEHCAILYFWPIKTRHNLFEPPPRSYTRDGSGAGYSPDDFKKETGAQDAPGNASLTVEEQFQLAIETRLEYGPDEIIADGEIHRFGESGDDDGKQPGWYFLNADDPAPFGMFGDWRLGDEKFKWRGQATRPLTGEERAEREKRLKERDNEEIKRQRAAARKAYKIWEETRGSVDPKFSYLVKKNVGVHGKIRQPDEFKIIVPVYEDGQELVSLQFITSAGEKRFLPDGKIKGCWFEIGVWENPQANEIVIVEGYATGATIHETTGLPVIVAFNAGNLEAVAKKIAAKHSNALIVIAGDDDLKRVVEGKKNTGVVAANAAAAAVGGVAVFAPFDRAIDSVEFSDWNDLAALRGKDKVADIFRQTIEEAKEHRESDDVSPTPPAQPPCLNDQTIRERINELHRKTESLDKLSPEYAALKDEAIALFAESSDNYRGDPNEKKHFRYQWNIDGKTLDKRLNEEDEKRRREQEAQHGGNPDDQQVIALNKDYCFVIEGGKATVYHECYDPVLKRHFLAPLGPRDFQYAFENQRVIVNTVNGPSEFGFGTFWLRHPERRQYLDGVVFDPANRHAKTQLNLWKGFGVTAKKGSWRRLKRHIFKVICGGDKKAFKYVMRWLANAVQHPEKQGEVVIVMRGGEGVGKGFLARAMVRLFGRHGLHIENPKHLTGNFNAHLHGCVMLFADEAFYAGDKAHTGILNGLITEPTIVIEKKGKDVYQSGNFIHLMMASNRDWVVPASLDARRFCVLDVLDIHKDDLEYFEAIDDELENGGYEAMLYDLQRLNLTGFNVRKFLKTAALQDQKILSMKIEQKWLYRVLCQGYVRVSDYGLEELEQWREIVTTQYLHDAYERYAKECGEHKPLDPVQFGKFMHDMGWNDEKKDKTQARSAFAGEIFKKEPGAEPDIRKNKERRPAYNLGTLTDARARFATATGLDLHWSDEGFNAEETDEETDEEKKELARALMIDRARKKKSWEWEQF